MADTQDESLMLKIQALIAPPQSSPAQKQKTKKTKGNNNEKPNQLRQENNPFCDACGEGGSLLCCDHCPSSFHFFCCDPPVDPKNLPTGDWLCRRCHPLPIPSKPPHPFGPLLEQACMANPLEFCLPVEMQKYDVFPGVSRKLLSKKIAAPLQDGDAKELYCYACNRGPRAGCLVSCDFCPLVFHLDCVHPPLSTIPTSVWMCPVHAEHMMPGFDHPRLTERLRALSESRVAVSCQNVKLDFLTKVNRIPHYKRLTRHHNRRAVAVPEAIKALYSSPLLDEGDEGLALSHSLLTQAELVSYHRWEEQQMRKSVVTTREPAITAEQDEWTREAIMCQLEQSEEQAAASKKPPVCIASFTSTGAQSERAHSDSEAFFAAQGLVELSQKVHLPNGVTKATISSNKSLPGLYLIEDESKKFAACNRRTSCESNGCKFREDGFAEGGRDDGSRDKGGGDEGGGDKGGEDKGGGDEVELLSNSTEQDGESGSMRASVGKEDGSSSSGLDEEETAAEDMDTTQILFVPDVSNLNPHLVRLLATQRLQQMFGFQLCSPIPSIPPHVTSSPHLPSSSSSSTLSPSLLLARQPNGLKRNANGHKIQAHYYDQLSSAVVILCPMSGVGSPRSLNTTATHIGLSSEMDICLKDYGHCNYLSSQHACIFYDKVADEYELINYSDHGSIVDGVLLCCDFAERRPPEPPAALTIDGLVAGGQGLRAERARLRLEAARDTLSGDKDKAKKTLEKVLSLPYRNPIDPDAGIIGSNAGGGLGTKRGQDAIGPAPNTPTMKTRKMSSRKPAVKNGEVVGGGGVTTTPSVTSDSGVTQATSCVRNSVDEPSESSGHMSTVERSTDKAPLMTSTQSPSQSCGCTQTVRSLPQQTGTGLEAKEELVPELSDTAESVHIPCLCQHSTSLLIGRGWEGTALLHHGSRVRFGCLQFVFSMAGKPGHSELVQAFLEAANSL